MHNILNIKSTISDYSVNFIDNIEDIVVFLNQENNIIVVDSNIDKLYPLFNQFDTIKIDCNEETKTLEGATKLLNDLIKKKANIKTKLIVVGGGILQDLVGFCASIYCRGIEYILFPTTLLSQADSCIGGKTSINFSSKKNILGTFYPPSQIIICTEFLNTLKKIDYISGLGEIYKFSILQNKIKEFNPNEDIRQMLIDGLKYKNSILLLDEFDKKERRFLNYGHTFGHALESVSKYQIPHGLAVILGCMIATRLAYELNYKVNNYKEILEKGISLFRESNLKLESEWFNLDSLMTIVKSDKKSTGKLTMVLVDDKPFLVDIKDITILKNILKQTYESI